MRILTLIQGKEESPRCHIQYGSEQELIELALAGLAAMPTLNIVIGCKDDKEMSRYASMLTNGNAEIKRRLTSKNALTLTANKGNQSIKLILLRENQREMLAGYDCEYLWFMGMYDTFSSEAFCVMQGSLRGINNAIITFGYMTKADRIVATDAASWRLVTKAYQVLK
ncbi:hypothetical protein [Vibrio sonorensis]|uniref:hypothetical protein n=1 Tax=Vibrio sonorensis TaxID=1004316 RepID=UPI0008DB1CF4|nr:hypothetical protein [Vibrio sonorensis]